MSDSGIRIITGAFIALVATVSYAQAEKIMVDGSTGVTPLVNALAKAYREHHPQTVIEIGKGLGTKARITALSEGKIDIAMASHGLDVAALERQGMVIQEVGKIAVVFGANGDVPLGNLSETQICDIFSGKLSNWKDVGGPDMPIAPVTRPESEVDTEVVRDRIGCFKNLRIAETVKVAPKAPDMAKELAASPGAIGMTTTTIVEQSHGRVKALSIGGISPTAQNVQNKTYLLTRDSFLITTGTASPAALKFLEYIRSSGGAKVIIANGAIPVK